MKTGILTSTLLFAILTLSAQTRQDGAPTGGLALSRYETRNPSSATRAVVVGISDYQSAQVPDLNYAHRDAGAFASWLQSDAGGNLPAENVRLLVNGEATQAGFAAALDWLAESSQAGDEAIIYFSGHGDVETKTFGESFLLLYDCPGQNYLAGGTFSVYHLQIVVKRISLGKNCRVVLITDACHAGNLAGNDIGGARQTGMNLQAQFANEVKIMSCQPNEISLEGAQWGGGRGVFSYHLLDGLTGLADRNEDAVITLSEIDRYLEDLVTAEVAPQVQTPNTVGDRQAILHRVDQSSLAALQTSKAQQLAGIAPTGSKNLMPDISGADSLVRVWYHEFETALAKGDLLEPKDHCANDLYLRLLREESLRQMHGQMRRDLAVALQDEVQQALNALLQSDPYEVNKWLYDPSKFSRYPDYLQRAIELLGEDHYMYTSLMSKKLYFEAYNMAYNVGDRVADKAVRDSIRAAAKAKLQTAIGYENRAAYLYFGIAMLYHFQSPPMSDSVVKYCQLALERSPKWILPCLEIAYELNDTRAEPWLRRAFLIDSSAYVVLERLAWLYQWTNNTEASLRYCRKMVETKPDLFNGYATMGVTWWLKREFGEAEKCFQQSMEVNPRLENWSYHFMIPCYIWTGRTRQATEFADAILRNDTLSVHVKGAVLGHLAYSLVETGQDALAKHYLDAWQSLSTYEPGNCFHLKAIIAFREGELEACNYWFNKALAEFETEPMWLHLRRQLYFALIEARKGHPVHADSIFRAGIDDYRTPGRNIVEDRVYIEELHFHYGMFLLHAGRQEEAKIQFQLAVDAVPGTRAFLGYFGLAACNAAQNDQGTALDYLEEALDNYFYPSPGAIYDEPAFHKLRKNKRFQNLMAKHFPEG